MDTISQIEGTVAAVLSHLIMDPHASLGTEDSLTSMAQSSVTLMSNPDWTSHPEQGGVVPALGPEMEAGEEGQTGAPAEESMLTCMEQRREKAKWKEQEWTMFTMA